jgi:hypothetical protein
MTVSETPEPSPTPHLRLIGDRDLEPAPPELVLPPPVAPPPPDAVPLRLRFRRLTQFGWPRRFPIVQFPNAPLIIAFLAGMVSGHSRGAVHADAAAISYLAMTIWAYEELVHGVNWFRHVLGFAYIVSTAVHLAIALRHG